MFGAVQQELRDEIGAIRADGLFKAERIIESPQGARIQAGDGAEVLNFCANNYLGLADDPRIVAAAKDALDRWGYGLASVRFICGTQDVHKQLEQRISAFLGTADTILYSSCFDANGGLFETLLDAQDAIISDELNHASIIDGVRLSKARRLRYRNRDMADLEAQLVSCADARRRLIATDGVFSMDGYVAPLADICSLADKYDAMVMVDDSHAVGFVGPSGRGTPELHGVTDRVDIVTGTLGKALGGASGGYTSGRQEIIDLLRQRSRPYLFSNSVAPAVAGASLAVLDLLADGAELRGRLRENTAWFRARMTALGFDILPGDHPIVPVMIGDAALATRMADLLLAKGVYVIGFSYPVVPAGQARIRTQLSAAHTRADLEFAADAFAAARAELLSHNDLAFIAPATAARPRCPVVWSTLVTSVSVKPRLAGRQPSSRGGVLRVRTWRLLIRQRQARVPQG
jgi:glycine C-acetyltransferase